MNPARPTTHPSLRIATLNLWWSETARAARAEAAAEAISALGAEVVCLQEVTDATEKVLERICTHLGWTQAHLHLDPGTRAGNAVISAHALTHTEVVALPPPPGGTAAALSPHITTARVRAHGRELVVGSTHLSWGSSAESVRVRQVQVLDAWFQEVCAPDGYGRSALTAVLGGDMNAVPEMSSMRWMRGLEVCEGRSTEWLDTWLVAPTRHPAGHDGATSTPENPWAAETAAVVGITHPELLPRRRIDHLMVRGYAHGSVGSPLQAGVWAEHAPAGHDVVASDHAGVWADLLV